MTKLIPWENIFYDLGIQEAEVLLIISDLNEAFKYFSSVERIDEIENIFHFLKSIASHQRYIVLPAFTHSFEKTRIFNSRITRPEQMGTLPIMAFKDQGFYRTLSPITSYLIWPFKPLIHFSNSTSTFGETSLFGWLKGKRCRIICIGGIQNNKLGWLGVHHAEEINKVPYRFKKILNGTIIDENAQKRSVTQIHFARRTELGVENDFSKLNKVLKERSLRTDLVVNNLKISAVWCSELLDICNELLQLDPLSHTNLVT
jgi:aminoglycoside 3-N-acetyltransferase